MKIQKIYIAEDGSQFTNEQECIEYEKAISVTSYNAKVANVCRLLNDLGVDCKYFEEDLENSACLLLSDELYGDRAEIVLPSELDREHNGKAILYYHKKRG